VVERKEYLDELIGWKDEQVIKAVTGIHRCGKSTLLRSIKLGSRRMALQMRRLFR